MTEQRLFVTCEKYHLCVSQAERSALGWWDDILQCWVHEIHHADGRVERFRSRSLPGELFEDHP